MTSNVKLLPLTEYLYGREASDNERVVTVADAHAYAVRNVAHATATKDVEIEALRAELREMRRTMAGEFKRAEQLAEALRFYADTNNWIGRFVTDPTTPAEEDGGDIARAALRDHDQEGKDG